GGSDPRVQQSIAKSLDEARGTERFVSLTKQFKQVGRRIDDLLDLARTHPDQSAGVAAAKLLVERGKWDDLGGAAWAKERGPAEAVIAALGRTGDKRILGFLTAVMDDENLDAARRKAAVAALARIRPGAERLLNRVENDELPPQLRQSAAVALQAASHGDLKDRIDAAFPPPPGREKPLPSLAELTAARGDVSNGKLVYMTTGTCSKCHVVKGVGREVGPDLTEIGDKLGRQAMYSAILYPSAGVSHNYETHTVLTDEGSVFNGLLVSDTEDELRIKDQDGIERTFAKASLLEHNTQDVSLMPADIQKLMTEQELVDLVEFLVTLKKRR
ncbi:MAG: dehydrogenase, partial [Planctomycetota bacterium]